LKHCVDKYRANKIDACEAIDDFDELDKLGQGFTSADPLEQVDIGDGSMPRPRLSQELVEHRLPIKDGFKPYKQHPR
jgi:hypothetical protein